MYSKLSGRSSRVQACTLVSPEFLAVVVQLIVHLQLCAVLQLLAGFQQPVHADIWRHPDCFEPNS